MLCGETAGLDALWLANPPRSGLLLTASAPPHDGGAGLNGTIDPGGFRDRTVAKSRRGTVWQGAALGLQASCRTAAQLTRH